ncbi:NADH-quinone oxidoreductase subunit NuoE [candidate division KSB1 bacterium]
MAFEFKEESLKEFNDIITRYPTKRAALLPALHLAQQDFGYITTDCIEYIAGLLDLTPAEVNDTLSFYTMYFREEKGKYVIQVCSTLSCSLLGSQDIVDYLKNKLGIKPGETTPDNKFSLLKVECLGSCGTAPVMRINNDYYEDLTKEKIDKLLEELP